MDERNHEAIKSKVAQKLGKFVGTHGKENCLVVCRTFGLTGCEWLRGYVVLGIAMLIWKKFLLGKNTKNPTAINSTAILLLVR